MTTPKRITMEDGQEYELVPVKKEEKNKVKFERWINVYLDNERCEIWLTFHISKDSADEYAKEITSLTRIDCIHIEKEYEVEG